MSDPLFLGIDLGGTKIAAGVVSRSGKQLSSVRVGTPASGVASDIKAIFDAAHTALAAARVNKRQITAIGAGVPGAVDPKTETVWAPNLPRWEKVPLRLILERALGRPAFVEADRNAQALAEVWLGAGSHVRNLVFLTVGTGIGAGIVSDGRIIRGSRGVAGAAGWMAIADRWQAEFARLGSLEAQAAGPAIARMARISLRSGKSGGVGRLAQCGGALTAEAIVEAARLGDARARRILAAAGECLGRGIASIIALLNPDLVVIGGGLSGAGEFLFAPMRRVAKKWGQPLASRHARIVRTRLGENAGILGAARVAMLELER